MAAFFDTEKFRNFLQNSEYCREMHYFPEIASTNTFAKAIARRYALHGTVVIADRQTDGRGRMGKSFFSPAGTGLYMSVIIRRQLPPEDLITVTACTATAVHRALAGFGIVTQIKWVNDLFLGGKKLCGILCEGGFSGSVMEYLVIGIGINIKKSPQIPEELQDILTDIETETGLNISREMLAAKILHCLEEDISGLAERRFLEDYTKYSCTLGARVQLVEREQEALAVAYTEDAGLLVRFDDGTEEVIRTGQARVLD